MSPAHRYLVRLYRRGSFKAEARKHLDRNDDRRLREVLEEMVAAHQGTLDLDLSDWSVVVLGLGGGPVWARVSVDPSGRTVVKR